MCVLCPCGGLSPLLDARVCVFEPPRGEARGGVAWFGSSLVLRVSRRGIFDRNVTGEEGIRKIENEQECKEIKYQ